MEEDEKRYQEDCEALDKVRAGLNGHRVSLHDLDVLEVGDGMEHPYLDLNIDDRPYRLVLERME